MEDVPYRRIVREGWAIIVVLAILGAVAAWGFTHVLPRTYSATSTMMLKVQSSQTSLYERNQFSMARIQSYPALVDSPEVIDGVRKDLDLDPSAYSDRKLAEMISASNAEESVLLTVRADAPTAGMSAEMANSAASHLSDLIAETENMSGDDKYSVELEQMIPASEPASPASPKVTAITGLGFIAGLALGAIVAVYRTTTNKRLRTIDDVRRSSGLPVVGQVPRPASSSAQEGSSLVPFQDLIGNLQALGGATRSLYVLLPSGPSVVDDALLDGVLTGYASTGQRACILDLREASERSSLARGFEDVLVESRSADADSSGTESARGDILFLDDPVRSRAEAQDLLGSIARLEGEYDVVLLAVDPDSTAVLEGIRAAGVGVVVTVRRSSTSVTELAAATTRLRVMGVRPIGVLMAHVPRSAMEAIAPTWRDADRESLPAAGS